MKNNLYYHQKDKTQYLQTFKRYPICFSHGKGSHLYDVEGNEYVDFLGGIAVNALGYGHPKLTQAICEQAEKMIHISNFFTSPTQVRCSEKLLEVSRMDRVFFTNSGAESVEGTIKVARKYAHSQGRGGQIISFTGSFHGRTMATIATGKAKMQRGFEPIPKGFLMAEFNNIDSVKRLISDETAAIIIEPIQGEGGINVAKPCFIRALRSLCDKENILLIFDEVQSGIGRTGAWFAKDHFKVQPDLMSVAKGLGGGMPVGAFLCMEKVGLAMDFGDHGTTFGGNPLACAAALACMEAIEEEGLMQIALDREEYLRNRIEEELVNEIKEVRGVGLMIGIEFPFETKEMAKDLLNEGVIANSTAGNVLRLVPPLVITENDIEALIGAIKNVLTKNYAHA